MIAKITYKKRFKNNENDQIMQYYKKYKTELQEIDSTNVMDYIRKLTLQFLQVLNS